MVTRIENVSSAKKGALIERWATELLANVPTEDLLGLEKITLLDTVSKRAKRNALGLYWPKTGTAGARIEVAVGTLYKGMPGVAYLLPFIGRFLLANVLFHELGHHYQTHVHGVRKGEVESQADMFKRRMIAKSFRRWMSVLKPIYPLLARLRGTRS